MKVELQCGDHVAIPEGCKAVINKNLVVFEKIVPFKTGDVLISKDKETTLIFDKMLDSDSFIDIYYPGVLPYRCFVLENFRLATEEEKQSFFDKMKEQGLRWNAEEKRVEKIRWRAKYGDEYWYVTSSCSVAGDFMREENSLTGEGAIEDWAGYNHFRKKAQAKEAAKRVRETLKKYCEEIGE